MNKYLVALPIEGTVTYIVEASNEHEAREIAYDGDGQIADVMWDTDDSENHTIDVTLISGDDNE